MNSIECSVIINVPDGTDIDSYIKSIQNTVSNFNSLPTKVNIVEIDDPLSLGPFQQPRNLNG